MKSFTSRTALLLAVLTPLAATAQIDPSTDTRTPLQAELDRMPSVEPGSEDAGDFDTLVLEAFRVRYRVFVENDIEYQTNANLDGDSGDSSFVWLPRVGGAAVVEFDSPFSIEATAALQSAFYTDVSDQDFWGANAIVRVNYELTDTFSLYAGSEVYSYESLEGAGNLSRGFAPTVGLNHNRRILDGRTHLFAGVRYQRHFVSPSASDRDTWTGSIGLTRQLSTDFFAQGFYEYRFSDYANGNRRDNRNSAVLALIYAPDPSFSVRTGLTYVENYSTVAAAEFKTFNLGLGAALIWQY